ILHGDKYKLLGFDRSEQPLALQIGGDNPSDLAQCAQIAEKFGYDEVNLNVGCPSSRVQNGNFGACLMLQPERVAECIATMVNATKLPVTIKHRIGVDEVDSYEDLVKFVSIVSQTGCQRFSVHARKAWLQGLSPKENREVPPLRYEDVHRLKQDFPHLSIEINGGFTNLEQVQTQLRLVDAVMIGRAIYDNPYLLATVDRDIYGDDTPSPSRQQIVTAMLPYIEEWTSKGGKLNSITRHMLQLFHGQPGSRIWKRLITEQAVLPGAGVEVVERALAEIPDCAAA
ncbi:tRNA dihydrouridine(20/20a) synthase DusA, partial [Chamaesiphon sp. OTE_75_metabat_556]|uniref:tRNA dihydrouridine(20/20a) synthase DusA n=1 Tax=Chamaesiphon sp. OTE_75_metabat_556 TaxID=2964692 RepID=UPI00286CB63D